jgi:cytochrome c oxidase subunit 2
VQGTYRGQCAEFCAISHANMRARAIALPQGEFDGWVARQLKPATMPQNPEVTRIFQTICLNCHTVRGIPNVSGIIAPDLTHLGDRTTFGGASFELNAANLFRWIDNPNAMKPLTGYDPRAGLDAPSMPDYGLSKDQIDAIVAYLMIKSG